MNRYVVASIVLLAGLAFWACGSSSSTSPTAIATETTPPATASPGAGSPTTAETPVTPLASPALLTPESHGPAASSCDPQPGGDTVTFDLVGGIPQPRCAQVTQDQHLHFDNNTGQTVVITFATRTITITNGQSADVSEPVGTYLAPGVHVAHVDFYGGSGPEIWVQP